MTQAEFSAIAKKYIIEEYPALLNNIIYKEDDSFDCEITSNKDLLIIWVTTSDTEITLGFKDPENKSTWHTHMSLFGAKEPIEELNAMSQLLNAILSNNEPVIFSSKNGFYLSDEPDEEIRQKESSEEIIIFKWNQL